MSINNQSSLDELSLYKFNSYWCIALILTISFICKYISLCMTGIIESNIFLQIRMGDEKAFNKLFDDYYAGLCLFASKYLRDMDQSRSLVQQVYIDIWVKRQKIEPISSVKSYLYSSVRNRCIDNLRKTKSSAELTDRAVQLMQTPFHDILEEAELNEQINRSIQGLPEKCREIFILCRFEGMKYSEIAAHLNISIKTVEMQISIALKKIRSNLTDAQMLSLLFFIYSKNN